MSKIICERCGKSQNGMIILTDQSGHSRQLCRDCHNEELAETMGIENFKDFIKIYQAKDVDGELHVFEIQKEIFPMGIKWVANEIKNSGYQFGFYAKLEDDPVECLQKLYRMINNGLSVKHVEKKQIEGQTIYSLPKDKLVGRIEWDEDGGGMPRVVIDGKAYSWLAVGKMLMGYEGWNVVMKVWEMGEGEE
jgi:hypothetical protein